MQGIIPPFALEIVLRDRSHFFVHSVSLRDEITRSLIARIWDFRACSDEDIEQIKASLNNLRNRSDLEDIHKIHSRLDWANLRLDLDEIAYCIEWHDRLWPEAEKPAIGFPVNR
jgi:hypothetical protein